MSRYTKCESCDTLIQPNQINIYDKTVKPGIQARLWECPSCNHKQLIMVSDKTARRMMQDNRKDREKISGINKQSALLRKNNKLTQTKAQTFLMQVEKIQRQIDKRTEQLDTRVRSLTNEYQEAL
ncbi:hypothetical protein GCM10011409_37860 [Lentibacillus populi]|uniref:Uncharacterized protein n=1 Tax=Lentibacillus populi TaxID=1827502 RepID=A0A9W5U0S7_9BACI|nr:hypothetical protein GCM10011409_37860 [Lentibacillus populi]